MRRIRRTHVLVAALAAALCVPASGAGSGKSPSSQPTKVGAGEGKLTMIAWEGYLDPKWVKPFRTKTGCKIQAKYAGSSDEMVTLMRSGGGGQYDMVSASGDASLRLIYGKDVQPVDPSRIPSFKDFNKAFQSPPNNTVGGKHYGISLQWGPNTLLYNTQKVKPAPTSWGAIYSSQYKGKITVPNNPIQIADVALYLSKTKPALGIKDPYELTKPQFDAAINLIKRQKPLIKKYWGLSSDEVSLFKNGDTWIGASWPVTTGSIQAAKVPVKEIIPKEGATGWLDTWMVSAKTKNLDCAYKWLAWISTPKVQAQQAIYFGETPVNTKACAWMDRFSKGSCHQYHADAPLAYFRQIYFWKTPIAACGNGKNDCMDYTKWQQAWTQLKG
jgi:putative spermidine/putrescine transport system substrate-binding protein